MNENWKICVVAVMIIASVFCVYFGLSWRDVGGVSDCVVNKPYQISLGHIAFSGDELEYSISLRGTTKSTGQSCLERVPVTRSQFERLIYGEEIDDISVQD